MQCNLEVSFLHSLFLFPVCIWKSEDDFYFFSSELTQFSNILPDHLLSSCGIRPTCNDKIKILKSFAILVFC